MSSSGNPSLAYTSTSGGDITISHRSGTKLYFCQKSGSSWINTVVDSKDVGVGATALAYGSSGTPFISYLKSGRTPGLYVGHRNATTWSTQQVDSQAKAAIYGLNRAGGRTRELEEAWIIQALVREDGMSQVEVAELLGRHKSWVCRRLALIERLGLLAK
jgi:hypothetical protein